MQDNRPICVFGPGPQYKGGMANYTTSLARAFDALDIPTYIISWVQQYPAIIPRDFIDRASKEDVLAGTKVKVEYITDYNKPNTWGKTVDRLLAINPSKVVIQWSIALQGLPLGFIVKALRKKSNIEVVFDLHFVIQKEQSAIDRYFTKFALKHATSYVVHAFKTADELKNLFPETQFRVENAAEGQFDTDNELEPNTKRIIKLYHPVYDMFKPNTNFDVEAFKIKHNLKKHVFLFFGFIRKYKGLHYCIEAFDKVHKQNLDTSLLIVGESFWQTLDNNKLSTKIKKLIFGTLKKILVRAKDTEDGYNPLSMIDAYGLKDSVMVINTFVANEAVYQYFQVADSILLFYEYATPSGVESMAYNFRLPALATAVGHFPETIDHGINGYLASDADTDQMADIMRQSILNPIDRLQVDKKAKQFSWQNYAKAILN